MPREEETVMALLPQISEELNFKMILMIKRNVLNNPEIIGKEAAFRVKEGKIPRKSSCFYLPYLKINMFLSHAHRLRTKNFYSLLQE